MNAAQSQAFEEGTGSYFKASELLWLIQALGSTIVFIYIAWLCLQAYKDFGDGYIEFKDLKVIWLRCFFIMMVLLYLIVN